MNSSQRLAVQRYAAAYDGLSQTNEEASLRAGELLEASKALASVEELLSSPQVPLEQKIQAVQTALANVPQVASLVKVLLEAKRYALLPAIVRQVEALLDVRLGITRAQVFSAQELTAQQKQQTEKALSARYGGTVKASFQTEPQLLGGLKIWCSGELIDGSLQGQFIRLQEELTK
ncbi:MAG: ATP synthase F1 subunit delta [Elusimicrobiaceae bacterium]|nr:ATP synthase F1 subunit delta [Elusimicrobiaceae bacterium]